MSYTGSVPDILTRPSWHKTAVCARPEYKDQSDELWFAPAGDRPAIKEAKRLCNSCPVQEACLRAEMAAEGDVSRAKRHGVRGGLTGRERRALYEELQRRKKTAA